MHNTLPIMPHGYTLHVYGIQAGAKASDYVARLVRPDGTTSMEWTVRCTANQLKRQVASLLDSIDGMLGGNATPPVYYAVTSPTSGGTARRSIERGVAVAHS